MAVDTVVLTEREVQRLQLGGAETLELVNQAQESDAADRLLTIRAALTKYKSAVFWAMFLSTSLVMEGYDLVIVSEILCLYPLLTEVLQSSTNMQSHL
jgi:SP family general alpha glucoside:H+ symporter-like MFS transporter